MSDRLTLSTCRIAANVLVESMVIRADDRIYGIPRGGMIPAFLVAQISGAMVVEDPNTATVIVDDLIDSGETMQRYRETYANHGVRFGALFSKGYHPDVHAGVQSPNDTWLTFPWEVGDRDTSKDDIVTRMLQAIGEDPTRGGLIETPQRVVKSWGELFSGYNIDPAGLLKTFEDGAESVDEMVLLTDIPVISHCEHHMVPFIGVAHVAYIPKGKIVGLSKIARVVDAFSRRLQVQERLTNQIADCINNELTPQGVGVVVRAKHFCMAMRGVMTPNVDTTTSAVRGCFKDVPACRAEFLHLVAGK